ncbi:50S ribosomal protein L23 [PVC group bacterium (ex Bugula neritina AB1)]|nr:50S ribosomal protein L23 [PVC group bacterium (ex Bugula neritina AB1)]
MSSYHDLVLYPHLTEKSAKMSDENKYAFVVSMDANKIEIAKAIESIYNVKVLKVNTLKIKSKKKRVRYFLGKTVERKKAIVKLDKGSTIDLI